MPEGDPRDRVGAALAEADESLTDRIAAVAFAGLLVANTEPADESIWPKSTITARLADLAVDDFFEQPH